MDQRQILVGFEGALLKSSFCLKTASSEKPTIDKSHLKILLSHPFPHFIKNYLFLLHFNFFKKLFKGT